MSALTIHDLTESWLGFHEMIVYPFIIMFLVIFDIHVTTPFMIMDLHLKNKMTQNKLSSRMILRRRNKCRSTWNLQGG